MVEAATAVSPFSRRMLHVGAVTQLGAKMSKSLGNLTLVNDLLQDHPPAVIRVLLLDRPWQDSWEFHANALASAAARLDRLYSAASRPNSSPTAGAAVTAALLDDLDVPTALNVAEDEGGIAARHVIGTLSLG